MVINAEKALDEGIDFWITDSFAVLCRVPISPDFIVHILDTKLADPLGDPFYCGNMTLKSALPAGTQATSRSAAAAASNEESKWGTTSSWSKGTWQPKQSAAPSSSGGTSSSTRVFDEAWWQKTIADWRAQPSSGSSTYDEWQRWTSADDQDIVDPLSEAVVDMSDDPLESEAKEELDAIAKKFLQENPGINEMDVSQRRVWEKYLRSRMKQQRGTSADDTAAKPPTKECTYCTAPNPLIELVCTLCYKPFVVKEKTEETLDDVRISHAIRRGLKAVTTWKWQFRGKGCGNRESQRAKDHYRRARQILPTANAIGVLDNF